mgnify:CR=1 FL=1
MMKEFLPHLKRQITTLMRRLIFSHYFFRKKNVRKNFFGEDIDGIKKRKFTTTYYIKDEGKMKPRNDSAPNSVNTYAHFF